ncbi:GntR family transcriptional regulator [Spiroplasma chinense]|uniref:GntR family transcriptional regulator n=1 Tax=Spiroplasma chinense TaxID=216932 RepID=A0A5B9Y562_9MOLU|nr:GntR family transcriptional regulator [Spiroplasma chinense]QEH62181.1 GntR family transcriptional regulator [Spiroplasma chinense]
MKKWEEIYNYLLDLIMENKVKAGEFLPSESKLRVKFKASLQPIRKAFSVLIADKLIIPVHGKGYQLINSENNKLFSFSYLYPNAKSIYKYLGKQKVDNELMKKTHFYYEDYVHKIEVKRYIGEKLYIYQISYISDSLLKRELDIEFIQKNGLMKFFTTSLKSPIGFAVKKISTSLKRELVDYDIDEIKSENLILDKGLLFSLGQQLMEYRESYYNEEEFEWSFIEYYR